MKHLEKNIEYFLRNLQNTCFFQFTRPPPPSTIHHHPSVNMALAWDPGGWKTPTAYRRATTSQEKQNKSKIKNRKNLKNIVFFAKFKFSGDIFSFSFLFSFPPPLFILVAFLFSLIHHPSSDLSVKKSWRHTWYPVAGY